MKPNIVYLHSHNTGQFIQPYGHQVPTPHLQRLAEQGVTFRKAFSTAPTCSPSRASFLSGMFPHSCGMLGLAHRGFAMNDYQQHMVHTLKANGYLTLCSGVEHTAPDISQVGYDRILSAADSNYPSATPQADATQAAISFLQSKPQQPFFLSLGLNETHRPFPKAEPDAYPAEDARYCVPPHPLPDTPETRADVADFKAAARIMDEHYGAFLKALDTSGLADNTLVLCFTDHGLQFPRHMCNLSDHGIAVYLIIRGPGGFSGGLVIDQLVSLIDLAPTVYDVSGIETPASVQGSSLRPLLQDEGVNLHRHIFAEVNYHAAYEPMRCIRSTRYKYIRRFDDRDQLVLANVDDTPSKAFLLGHAWTQQPREQEMLYDLIFDPDETHNLINDPGLASIQSDLALHLHDWMVQTKDPLIAARTISAPAGSKVNRPDDLSPNDPIQAVSNER